MKRALTTIVVAALAAALSVSCAAQPKEPASENPSPLESGFPKSGGIVVDWDNPINGVEVASVRHAQEEVAFTIHEPQSLGEPSSILVSPPEFPLEDRVVAFVFNTPEYGRVIVQENPPDVPPDEYEERAREMLKYNGQPTTHGRFEFVSVRGHPGLLTVSEDESEATLFWLESPSVEFVVRGPGLSPAEAQEVAEGV